MVLFVVLVLKFSWGCWVVCWFVCVSVFGWLFVRLRCSFVLILCLYRFFGL